MEVKNIQTKLLNINEQILKNIERNIHEEDITLSKLFSEIEDNKENEIEVVNKLIEEIITNDNILNENIFQLNKQIEEIISQIKPPLNDIELKKQELEKSRQDLNKSFVLSQKKKKTDIINKITNHKKDLSSILKSNNQKISDDEKDTKTKELEYIRRLSIDLDRLNDANEKQYIELEKSILNTEDEKEIKKIQNKINSIRTLGLKESLSVKNKHSLLVYENNLEFKKSNEKYSLDNNLVSEEYKVKIKTLESEKELLNLEENQLYDVTGFENEGKIIQLELENDLNKLQFETEKNEKILEINEKIESLSNLNNETKLEKLNYINNEITTFDNTKVNLFKEYELKALESENALYTKIVDTMKNSLLLFKDLINFNIEYYYNGRNNFLKRITNLLLSNNLDQKYDLNYTNLNNEVKKLISDYIILQNENNKKILGLIDQLFKNLINQLNMFLNQLEIIRKERELSLQNLYKNFVGIINLNYKLVKNNVVKSYEDRKISIGKVRDKALEKHDLENARIVYATKTVQNEYNLKTKNNQIAINKTKKDYEIKNEKIKFDLKLFIKQSKKDVAKAKQLFIKNIRYHEKFEHKKYLESINENQVEFKNRLRALKK